MKEDVKEKTVGTADADYSLEAVPVTARKGFRSMFFVMLGFTFFSASMSVGAKLGNGLDLSGFIWACIIGGLILSAYCGILAYIGSDTGLNMDLLCRHAFGTRGSYLSSFVLGFTQIGWFGVGVAMFSIPTAQMLGINEWVLTIAAGLLMTATAATGMKALEIVSTISVPLIVVLGVYSMVTAAADGGGLVAVFSQSAGRITLFTGIGYVIGSFISGGTATPNFIRFAKNNKVAVWTTVIAFFLGNTLMFCFGAVGGAFTGADDIFYVMIAQGLAIPAIIVLGANIWTTNNNALYTGGLALSNIFNVRMKITTWIAGIVGTALAIWLYWNFTGWLSILNCALPPVGTIVILDYFRRKSTYKENECMQTVRWFNVAGIVIGALAANLINWGIAAVNAMVIASAAYFVGALLERAAGNRSGEEKR
ncbi:MAG: cytosine permease [Lentihominibacter sp.]|nr:cytosine permease [Lentihominibacter sp.]